MNCVSNQSVTAVQMKNDCTITESFHTQTTQARSWTGLKMWNWSWRDLFHSRHFDLSNTDAANNWLTAALHFSSNCWDEVLSSVNTSACASLLWHLKMSLFRDCKKTKVQWTWSRSQFRFTSTRFIHQAKTTCSVQVWQEKRSESLDIILIVWNQKPLLTTGSFRTPQ